MAYGRKVKFHYDIPIYIKQQLVELAKKERITATEMLCRIIEEEYARIMAEKEE